MLGGNTGLFGGEGDDIWKSLGEKSERVYWNGVGNLEGVKWNEEEDLDLDLVGEGDSLLGVLEEGEYLL